MFLIRVLIALAVCGAGFFYFRAVFPPSTAAVVAIVLAVAELFGPVFMRGGRVGGSLWLLVKAGVSLLVWPGAALLLEYSGRFDRGASIAIAAAAACACGALVSRHGSGQDNARMSGLLVAVALPVYAVFVAASVPSPVAWVAAAFGVAVAAGVTHAAGVWPARHEGYLVSGAAIAGCAALALVVRALI